MPSVLSVHCHHATLAKADDHIANPLKLTWILLLFASASASASSSDWISAEVFVTGTGGCLLLAYFPGGVCPAPIESGVIGMM